jgi:CheY-like chemotaxis protein
VREIQDAALSGIPVIAMTAFARPEDQSKAIAAGFQVHLAKPLEPDHLVSTCADKCPSFCGACEKETDCED